MGTFLFGQGERSEEKEIGKAAGRGRSRALPQFAGLGVVLAALLVFLVQSANAHLVADTIYTNGVVVTMDGSLSTAQAVAIKGKKIIAVGSNSSVSGFKGSATQVIDLNGATLLPGFIDSHSHMLGYGVFSDTKHWLDVSNVNVFFKPLPGDPRCTHPSDPQQCFIPVQTEDDVINRLKAAVASAPTTTTPVLAFNYDPSRLGHSSSCPGNGVGFECPNLENGTSRQTLDQLSATNPICIASESGHISYVNTPALAILNICGTDVAKKDCYQPITNPVVEKALAQTGQLDEDLALFGTGKFVERVFAAHPRSVFADFRRAVSIYAQHGFTLVQEGLANGLQIDVYAEETLNHKFPATAAMFVYEALSADFNDTIKLAQRARALVALNPNLFIAAVKSFADGSTQGYTGYLTQPYFMLFPPFTFPPFMQPYTGLPNLDEIELGQRAMDAHTAGFPIAIHQNGDNAIANSLAALQMAGPSPGVRDWAIHAQLASPTQLATAKSLGAAVTFLMGNYYYYGLPMCQQILGQQRTAALYPAADAVAAGLRFGLHSDAPVAPPDALFAIWVAKTRLTQQPSWYPNNDPTQCPPVLGPAQAISILQGMKAYTTDAAWLYGMEDQLGSIETGKLADLVILSDNPLAMENNPDNLKTIRILGTVHHGHYFPNPNANQPPIWPG